MIVGIDEVGRGPWAGPLVVAAVVLGDANIEGLADSKKLTKRRREELYGRIISESAAWALGWVDADEIDRIGLSAALREATKRALSQITVPYHEIIIDGTVNFLADTKKGEYVTLMKKADSLIASVSAASIIAKVARDDHMAELADAFPGYDFESNVGYGTARHIAALERLGVTPIHRTSFAPVAKVIGSRPAMSVPQGRSTKHIGDEAETAAAAWLETKGHRILERNWKTRFCEVDIISSKDDSLYFVEVKHRRGEAAGDGLAAITPRKLRQMRFAATMYATRASPNAYLRLAAIATSGPQTSIDSFVLIDD